LKFCAGEILVFLNNDTQIITPDWLEQMSEIAMLPDVATVGPMLLYEDGTIQHAGVVVGMGGWADHVFKGQIPHHLPTPFVSSVTTRNVLAVTGACMVIERAKFEQLGRFDESV
jgi:GT2 family glycosyltransferase